MKGLAILGRATIYALLVAFLIAASRSLYWRTVAVRFQDVSYEILLRQIDAVQTLQEERMVAKKKDELFKRIRSEVLRKFGNK